MRILVREGQRTKRYESWPHYKSTTGSSYPDLPTVTLDDIEEVNVEVVDCPYCWGGPYLTRAANGEGYVRSTCPRCDGLGIDFKVQ